MSDSNKGNGNEGGGQATAMRAMAMATAMAMMWAIAVNILGYVSQAIANRAIAKSEHCLKMVLNIRLRIFKSAKAFSDARNSCSLIQ